MRFINITHLFLLLLTTNNLLLKVHTSPIIQGEETKPGEIKYVVAIRYLGAVDEFVCGGGIIEDDFIVSAAHCFINETTNEFFSIRPEIVAGVNDVFDFDNRIIFNVSKIYVPAKFNAFSNGSDPYEDDVAVLKLGKNLDIAKNNLEKLTFPRNPRRSFAGHKGLMAGFGWDKVNLYTDTNGEIHREGGSQGFLTKADVKVLNNTVCNDMIKDTEYPDTITNSHVCAQMYRDDMSIPYGACTGDSGSPLVVDSKFIGVLSWGSDECDERDHPAVFTRLTAYMNFIENAKNDKTENMRTKSFE